MDNSNPEQQICDSQVLGSTSSLSLPSEPPDIRNWFPSYEYESPVLDIFGDSVSKEIQFAKSELVMEGSEGEKEENPGGLKKIRKRDEEFVVEKLCSNGFVKGSSFLGSDKLEGPSLNELADSCHSSSLLSEPPDIRNWFASYVYESPVLDTSNYFGYSLSKESECEYDGVVNEESNIETGETLGEVIVGENVQSDGVVKCDKSFGNNLQKQQPPREGDDGIGGNKIPSSQHNWCFGRPFEQSLKVQILEDDGVPTKDVSSLILEGSQCTAVNISETSGRDDRKSVQQFIYKRDSTHGSSGKESSEGKDNSENGFVTTRNVRFTRINNENFVRRRAEGINKSTVPLAGGKNGVIERKVLAETTNFHYSDAMEVAGQWRCPQKSKPNLGPPLKQLRLEQWIHRM